MTKELGVSTKEHWEHTVGQVRAGVHGKEIIVASRDNGSVALAHDRHRVSVHIGDIVRDCRSVHGIVEARFEERAVEVQGLSDDEVAGPSSGEGNNRSGTGRDDTSRGWSANRRRRRCAVDGVAGVGNRPGKTGRW